MTTAAEPVEVLPQEPVVYGSFLVRFRALVLDTAVLIGGLLIIVFGVALLPDIPGVGRAAVVSIGALALLYEPVMVSRFGATLGHRWSNLRVVSERTGANPTFGAAFLRFLVKGVLGLPSFIVMALTRRHQAVHDRIAGTTVRIQDIARARITDVAWERSDAELAPPGLPSRMRRALVTVAYALLTLAVTSWVTTLVASGECLASDVCTTGESVRVDIAGIAWFALTALCVIAGWRGRLWGARAGARAAT